MKLGSYLAEPGIASDIRDLILHPWQNELLRRRFLISLRRVLVIRGPTGTGKSTLIRGLAHELGWHYQPVSAFHKITASQIEKTLFHVHYGIEEAAVKSYEFKHWIHEFTSINSQTILAFEDRSEGSLTHSLPLDSLIVLALEQPSLDFLSELIVHLWGVRPVHHDVNWRQLSELCSGLSGAELAMVLDYCAAKLLRQAIDGVAFPRLNHDIFCESLAKVRQLLK